MNPAEAEELYARSQERKAEQRQSDKDREELAACVEKNCVIIRSTLMEWALSEEAKAIIIAALRSPRSSCAPTKEQAQAVLTKYLGLREDGFSVGGSVRQTLEHFALPECAPPVEFRCGPTPELPGGGLDKPEKVKGDA